MRLEYLVNIIIKEYYKLKLKIMKTNLEKMLEDALITTARKVDNVDINELFAKDSRTDLEVLLYRHNLQKTDVSKHLGWSRPRLDRWLRNPENQIQENLDMINMIKIEIKG